MRRAALTAALAIISSVVVLSFGAGPAFAVSGGGYSGANQNCPPGYADNMTPADETYPGCHTIQLSVESGGTDGHGNPTGASNTHYLDMGFNQEPNGYLNEPCIGFIECPGTPGQNASLHSGCAGANTDGTGSAPAPAGSAPEDPGTAGDASNGCGDNPNGLGFSANFDYYQFLNLACPTVNQSVGPLPQLTIPLGGAGTVGFGDPCAYKSKQVGHTTVTPHSGTAVAYKPILKKGLIVYFGGDDNQNHGEHDGVGPYTSHTTPNDNGAENGTSDGTADTISVTPQNAGQQSTPTHPEGAVNASIGVICTEGICAEATTQQHTVYYGCDAPNANGNAPCDPGTPSNGNVYDYSQPDPSANSESQDCNNQAPSNSGSCGPGGENADRSATPRDMNTEPGVQIYEDPDPGRSPLSQYFGNPQGLMFPTPGAYAGTCGVTAGSPTLPTAQTINSTPFGNGAGQAQVKTADCGGNQPLAKHAQSKARQSQTPQGQAPKG